MNAGQPDDLPGGIDEVGKAYRAADFGDTPPAHVDSLIIATARRAVRRRPHTYLPSVALAATVMLALGLVLRLTIPGREMAQPTNAPAARSAPAVMDETEALRVLPAETGAATAETVVPVRQSATAANEASPATNEGIASAGRAALQYLAPDAASEACAPLRAGEPAPWLECIRARLEAGEPEEARAELAILRLTHPDFAVPNELAERLGP